MFKLLVFTCLLSGWALGDITDGLGCKTNQGFTYCDGKSPTYNKLAGVVEEGKKSGGLDTRSKDNNDLMTRHYGVESHKCDGGSDGSCQVIPSSVFPTLLYNNNNDARFILQLGAFKQGVLLNICTGNSACGDGFCDQKFTTAQLLSWDPFDQYPVLLVDSFRIPSCCKCKQGGRPGGGWK